MLIKTKGFQLILALLLGILVMLLPRPEGTTFSISGDADRTFFQEISPALHAGFTGDGSGQRRIYGHLQKSRRR